MSMFVVALTMTVIPGAASFPTVYSGPYDVNGQLFNNYVQSFYNLLTNMYSVETSKLSENIPRTFAGNFNQLGARDDLSSNVQSPSSNSMFDRSNPMNSNGIIQSGTQFNPSSRMVSQFHLSNPTARQFDSLSHRDSQLESHVHPSWQLVNRVYPSSHLDNHFRPSSQSESQLHLSSQTLNNVHPSSQMKNQVDPSSSVINKDHGSSNTISQTYPSNQMVHEVHRISQSLPSQATSQLHQSSLSSNNNLQSGLIVNKVNPSAEIVSQVHPASQGMNQFQRSSSFGPSNQRNQDHHGNLIIRQNQPTIELTNQTDQTNLTVTQTVLGQGQKQLSDMIMTSDQQITNLQSPTVPPRQYPNQFYYMSKQWRQVYPQNQPINQLNQGSQAGRQADPKTLQPYQTSHPISYVNHGRNQNNHYQGLVPQQYPSNQYDALQTQRINQISNFGPHSEISPQRTWVQIPSAQQLTVRNRLSTPLQNPSGTQEARFVFGRRRHPLFQPSYLGGTGQTKQTQPAACDTMEFECVPSTMCVTTADIQRGFRCAKPNHVCCDT